MEVKQAQQVNSTTTTAVAMPMQQQTSAALVFKEEPTPAWRFCACGALFLVGGLIVVIFGLVVNDWADPYQGILPSVFVVRSGVTGYRTGYVTACHPRYCRNPASGADTSAHGFRLPPVPG